MDRILLLMAAPDYAEAQTALYSARENAAHPDALSYGLTLREEPTPEEESAMAALQRVQFLCPAEDAWAAMPALWQGESHVLMAHPAMRFTPGWDKALLKALADCARDSKPRKPSLRRKLQDFLQTEEDGDEIHLPIQQDEEPEEAPRFTQQVLTGYLPVRDDPLDAVCPVAADCITPEGGLVYRHGVPLHCTTQAQQGPFLHPDFCFGPAGFFRLMAGESSEAPFLRAFRDGWALYTPAEPVIRLLYDLPVPACPVPLGSDLAADFLQVFGVDFDAGVLSAQSRRGMIREELDFRQKVTPLRRLREWYRSRVHEGRMQSGKDPSPLCVTLYTADMPEETLRWLRRLAGLRRLPLLAYADPLLVRAITDFQPNVMEFKPRYLMGVPAEITPHLRALSKAAILTNARDRELTHSHYVWMDADSVQYPLYAGTAFDWKELCGDRIAIAVVGGVPDPTMFVVPEALLLRLSREMEARCLTWINQRGELPAETELWSLLLREHPEWFRLFDMPVQRQLFTHLHDND